MGRFPRGNPGFPGNPHAAKVGELHSALRDAVTPDDIRSILDALVTEAKADNVPAMREFLSRDPGQPQVVDAIERTTELEVLSEHLDRAVTGDLR
mgnify:FL=1